MSVINVDKTLKGKEIRLGTQTIRPVARLSGWYRTIQTQLGRGFFSWLHVKPMVAIVRDSDGSETPIPIQNKTEPSLAKLLSIALTIAVVSEVVILWTVRYKDKRQKFV